MSGNTNRTEISVNVGDTAETSLLFVGEVLKNSNMAIIPKANENVFAKWKKMPKKMPIQINQKRIPVKSMDVTTRKIIFEKKLGEVLTEEEINELSKK